MLTINPASLRATLGDAAAHAATGGSPPSASADPAGFASLLRQTRTVAAPPAPPPAPAPASAAESKPASNGSAPADGSSNEAEASPESTDAASRARALLKGKLRAADGIAPGRPAQTDVLDAKKAGEAADASDSGHAPTEACNAPETKAVATATPLDPGVMQWLAGLQGAVSGSPNDAGVDAGGKTATDEADASAVETRGTARGLRTADLKADADLKDKAAQGKARLADAAGASPFAGALAEQRSVEKTTQPLGSVVGGAKEAAAAAAGALAPAPSAGTGAAAPAAVAIAAPVGAPDFAQELGLRLSVLARDGVQTAELHLNPADMGPVSVQIVMDGTQARVDFGADMAATRQAIEAGLPELASALRDAGFTLAGGGVSQHAGGRGGGDEPGSSQRNGQRGIVVEDDVKRIATAARRIVAQGGVDLFA